MYTRFVKLMKLTKPTMIVNKTRVINSIKKMITKAEKSKVQFRPHFKTHQSADIGKWFKELDVKSIAVSSVDMAEYFAENGWEDITIAFLVNLNQIDQINSLASKIKLGLLVDSFETVNFLKENLTANVVIWIKIDTDYHRTGIHWDNESKISKLIREIKSSEKMDFEGLLTHAGHAYKAKSTRGIEDVFEDTVVKLKNIQERLFLQGFSIVKLSIGNTPVCSVVEDFTGVDEIRPGNFVFYDVSQFKIGSCKEQDIAMAIACPIVAKYPERNEIVIYGGAIHLSKDILPYDEKIWYFGLVTLPSKDGWSEIVQDVYVKSLSQEHGTIHATEEFIESVEIGDFLYILPIHSCLTANLLKKYITLEGKTLDFNNKI
ncbi:MAG: alanine racemase [Asgard group archaeon]|nr:alanine racemase [Asgard group archaeon]